MKSEDYFLQHYGIKGMKWGVRRSDAQLAKTSPTKGASKDVKNVQRLLKTANASGTKALTNQEMQAVISRMSLEKQYSALANPNANTKSGAQIASTLLVGVLKSQGQRILNQKIGGALDSRLNKPATTPLQDLQREFGK